VRQKKRGWESYTPMLPSSSGDEWMNVTVIPGRLNRQEAYSYRTGSCNTWECYAISTQRSTGPFDLHCRLRSISENCRVTYIERYVKPHLRKISVNEFASPGITVTFIHSFNVTHNVTQCGIGHISLLESTWHVRKRIPRLIITLFQLLITFWLLHCFAYSCENCHVSVS
jgi:hypothetical protein